RRVWRQMIRDTANRICTAQDKSSGCRNEVSRTVWDGDQVLYDVKIAADTIGEASEGYPTNATFTGSVGYTHAGGVDTPLDLFKGTDIVLPYADYRGQFDKGTCPGTACSNAYYFPGNGSSAFEEPPTPANGPPSWYGELITGMADGSGYQYKRNRYFNPSSGQFTQEDPIGLAGGLSSYGFGGGDPVEFSDPFGLCPPADRNPYDCPGKLGALVMLGQVAPQINREVALFIPKNLAMAATGMALEAAVARVAVAVRALIRRATEEAATAGEAAPATMYEPVAGGPRSVPNVKTNLTAEEFGQNLSSTGWSRSVSKDGKAILYEKDGARYSVRMNSNQGSPTGEYTPAGKTGRASVKIRLRTNDP
ncbi:MAG: RHS repeat-associated core domain-containing protein, partial [Gemmatimonadetes bacterium]|nr:RHS repeat-associated core domain-containing protein [Gemmatimonadota bacterium]